MVVKKCPNLFQNNKKGKEKYSLVLMKSVKIFPSVLHFFLQFYQIIFDNKISQPFLIARLFAWPSMASRWVSNFHFLRHCIHLIPVFMYFQTRSPAYTHFLFCQNSQIMRPLNVSLTARVLTKDCCPLTLSARLAANKIASLASQPLFLFMIIS